MLSASRSKKGEPKDDNHSQGGELSQSATTTPALDSPRPFRAILRHSGLSAIDELDEPSRRALAREKRLLLDGGGMPILLPAGLALAVTLFPSGLSGTPARLSSRLTKGILVFCLSRFATAWPTATFPDPRILVPWPRALRSALRSISLGLESSGIGLLSCLLCAAATCAAIELAVRRLVARLGAHLSSEETSLRSLFTPDGGWEDVLSGVPDSLKASLQSPAALWRVVNVTSQDLGARVVEWGQARREKRERLAAAAAAEAEMTDSSSSAAAASAAAAAASASAGTAAVAATRTAGQAGVERARPGEPAAAHNDSAADESAAKAAVVKLEAAAGAEAEAAAKAADGSGGEAHAEAAKPKAPAPSKKKEASGRTRWQPEEERPAPTPTAEADASLAWQSSSAGVVASWYAPKEQTHRELSLLMRRASSLSLVHGALAACSAVWALEAFFLLLVCLGQRLRLLTLRLFTRAAPAAQDWVSSLPRNTEEATAQFNYQLNLIGLQTEQWMTDTWAGYLRQRRKWLSGSSKGSPPKKPPPGKGGKGGGKGGGGLGGLSSVGASVGGWWDERVAATNKAWVGFQIKSAKAAKPGVKGRGGEADSRGAARKQQQQQQQQQAPQQKQQWQQRKRHEEDRRLRGVDEHGSDEQPKAAAAKKGDGTHLFSWIVGGRERQAAATKDSKEHDDGGEEDAAA